MAPVRRQHCTGLTPPGFVLAPPPAALNFNFTADVAHNGNVPWLIPLSRALSQVVRGAFSLRLLVGGMPWRADEMARAWQWVWCTFLSAIDTAVAVLPGSGRVTSALGVSAEQIASSLLPEALQGMLTKIAAGKLSVDEGRRAVQNVSLVALYHLECALLLGEEALHFGETRVKKAIFHGESINAGYHESVMHRADAILWALSSASGGHGAACVGESPRIAEIGVHIGEVASRILERHPTLRWLGIDPYECDPDMTNYREGATGSEVLRIVRSQLQPWLGGRAQLLVARSDEVLDAEVGDEHFDLVFVDARHSFETAAADIATWGQRVKPGGLVAGHDYAFAYYGVVQAAHASLPAGAVLHLAPNSVYWWQVPGAEVGC